MLQIVDVGEQPIEPYAAVVGPQIIEEIRELARPLKGARIAEINATPYGGGVSEILRSEVPLLRDLGLQVDWLVISGDDTFFNVTKAFHNALQGADHSLATQEKETYLTYNTRNAALLDQHYDYIVVHDPQPLAIRHLRGRDNAKWIWRCHIDTSSPNMQVWDFLRPFVDEYDAVVFTMKEFVPPGVAPEKVKIIAPAIDPLSPKNMPLPVEFGRRILDWIGVEGDKPLLTQVSRFDPWKDPLGVIQAYRLVRQEVPDLQLALVGSMASDDPEGWEIYSNIVANSAADPLIHVFTNFTGVGNVEVNAFQRLSDVAIQKSIREGFGLVVSETLWKGTPIVAGRAGGIPMQMPEGTGGFLVDSPEEAAEKILYLLQNRDMAQDLAAKGREVVRQHYLMPRHVRDWLALWRDLL